MQHGNSTKQYRKTRNQRKREARQTYFMVGALLIMWVLLLGMFVKALDHPAEQPVSYAAHMEVIGGDSYGNLQD